MPERFGVGEEQVNEENGAGRPINEIGLFASKQAGITEVIWQSGKAALAWAVVPPAIETCKRPLR